MTKNVGSVDRILRIAIGLGLLAYAIWSGQQYAWLGYLGVIPILTALTSNCPLYSLLGISSCPVSAK